MAQIKCPKCGEIITLDKSSYDELLSNIEKDEIKTQVEQQLELLKKNLEMEHKLDLEKNKSDSDKENEKLRSEIESLKQKLDFASKQKDSEIKEALAKTNQELERKKLEIEQIKASSAKDIELEKAKTRADNEKAIHDLNLQVEKLRNELKSEQQEHQIEIDGINKNHEIELKSKDEAIAYYKDLKTKASTKMLGETLEQHCQIAFDQIRMTAFPDAYFEKDNDASSGSKGDFIFREKTEEGAELISIMFEMKNEADDTAKKHKNEDFFKELDKDRNEKKCEYAVLVSTLESDNELYNAGIVDVSYRYPKMYVVRPQCFIPIITLLRNAAKNSEQWKNQLVIAQNQSVDVTNFENNLNDFKDKFGKNYEQANKKFADAIKEIDKTIDELQKVKDNLLGADRNLRLANDKLQDVSIKRLTKNSPSVRAKFEAIDEEKQD